MNLSSPPFLGVHSLALANPSFDLSPLYLSMDRWWLCIRFEASWLQATPVVGSSTYPTCADSPANDAPRDICTPCCLRPSWMSSNVGVKSDAWVVFQLWPAYLSCHSYTPLCLPVGCWSPLLSCSPGFEFGQRKPILLDLQQISWRSQLGSRWRRDQLLAKSSTP